MADAPQTPRPKVTDIAPWINDHMAQLDTNQDGGIDRKELFGSFKRKDLSAADGAMILTVLGSFELLDEQHKPDQRITLKDVHALKQKLANSSDPLLEDHLKTVLTEARDRTRDQTPKLWGEFSKPVDAIKPAAVSQGAVGDCWFLAALAAVADTSPELIAKMIEPVGHDKFRVNFPGLPNKPIVVDAPTPVEMALFARGTKYGSWVAVIEKAAAKVIKDLRGEDGDDIFALHGGEPDTALKMLTGLPVVKLSGKDINIKQKLDVAHQWGLPIVCGSHRTGSDEEHNEQGVYYTHAYSAKYHPRTKQVEVRNPWGWSRRAEPSLSDGRPADGTADGAFKLTVADFQKSFPDIWVVVP